MPPKKKILKPPTATEEQPPLPITLAQEVEVAVKEWYAALGKPVPKEDQAWVAQYYTDEQEEQKQFEQELATPEPPAKPSFGSPEYWKDYWAKKKAAGYVTKKDAKAAAAAAKTKETTKNK